MKALIFFLLSFAALGFAFHCRFLHQLRKRHPAVWQSLGQPSLFWSNTMGTRFEVWRFLWKKDYRDLADPQFNRIAGLLRTYKIAYLILFIAIVIGSFIWSYATSTHHI
jgi:hypothetical protein